MNTQQNNPLLHPFPEKHGAAPFDRISTEHFLSAIQELIQTSKNEIDALAENAAAPTLENTVEALSYSGMHLENVTSLFFNLNSAETSDEMQKIALELSPLLTEYGAYIIQNEKLFERVKKVYEDYAKKDKNLTQEQRTLLTDTYKNFIRNGAELSPEQKEDLVAINTALAKKTLEFGQHVLGATNDYYKHITNADELAGLPDDIQTMYAEEAKNRNLSGWVITLQYPSYVAALTYLENRALRKEIYLANGEKNLRGDHYDTTVHIHDILALRQQKAKLLGYSSYADYILEERMAASPEKVRIFLEELLEQALPYARQEIEELKTLAKAEGIDDMQAYDHAYFAEKLRKKQLNLSDEELKPYFPLEAVERAAFGLAEKLFGLLFKKAEDISVYHKDLHVFEVYEKNTDDTAPTFKALLYTDYFPRDGKRAGAWMTSYQPQYKKDGKDFYPHVSIVCNFAPPVGEVPSLLTFQEVTTLFHEFGHALHGLLADTTYPSLSGTSVKWDFVELPSQFFENYCYEPEFLQTFAKHYKTGASLPQDKIAMLARAKSFLEGYQTVRQIGFGLLDLAYHTAERVDDVQAFEREALQKTKLYPEQPTTSISNSFSHIFQGGYAAGYYSYKWAEVLDADAFYYFKENGIYDETIAAKFKKLLASGGTVPPMDLYREFRGAEPKVENLLRRAFGNP